MGRVFIDRCVAQCTSRVHLSVSDELIVSQLSSDELTWTRMRRPDLRWTQYVHLSLRSSNEFSWVHLNDRHVRTCRPALRWAQLSSPDLISTQCTTAAFSRSPICSSKSTCMKPHAANLTRVHRNSRPKHLKLLGFIADARNSSYDQTQHVRERICLLRHGHIPVHIRRFTYESQTL
jgi:hypothetical protein